MSTEDRDLVDLMAKVEKGKIQLPDFQRGWVWDDNRIKALILSVIRKYPVGAIMFLKYGAQSIHFKYKPIDGAPEQSKSEKPDELILDGQQRLTSLYNALYSPEPVSTKTDKGKPISRYYYIDISEAMKPDCDDEKLIRSIPENKIVTRNFGKEIVLDLSTREKEFEKKMFPLNLILKLNEERQWENKYKKFYNYNPDIIEQLDTFYEKYISPATKYKIPVISLSEDTPKEAVCQVFENVNTGGVSLTVFELVTAIFAMDGKHLREDWKTMEEEYFSDPVLSIVTATDFLTSMTLLTTYLLGHRPSCKKKDVLNLKMEDFYEYAEPLCKGFNEAKRILNEEKIYYKRDLPYSTQLIPLAAICTVLLDGDLIKQSTVKEKLKQWYWCGVMGELYGAANETRYANDIEQVVNWIKNNGELPKTINDAYFNPMRLTTLQTRQAAAYKGIMALVLKNNARDFISGEEMDFTLYQNENIDIHHIFPKKHCIDMGYAKSLWNSVINKTPITGRSNKVISGKAPSIYLKKLEDGGAVTPENLDAYLESHLINHELLRADDFHGFIVDRAIKILNSIEKATGKKIAGRDSAEVHDMFNAYLL